MHLFFSLHWIACIIRKTNAEQKLKELKINIYLFNLLVYNNNKLAGTCGSLSKKKNGERTSVICHNKINCRNRFYHF